MHARDKKGPLHAGRTLTSREAAGSTARPVHELDDYDWAILADGSDRAVSVALVALSEAGTIDCGEVLVDQLAASGALSDRKTRERLAGERFVVRPVRPLEGTVHPVTEAVYAAVVGAPVVVDNLGAIRVAAAATPAVKMVRDRLVQRRLLRSDRERAALRRQRLARSTPFVLAVLAIFSVVGITTAEWSGLGYGLVGAATALAIAALPHRRTPLGFRTLTAKRQTVHVSIRARAPLDTTEPGLRVALWGEEQLWTVAPSLAVAFRVTHPDDVSSCCGCA